MEKNSKEMSDFLENDDYKMMENITKVKKYILSIFKPEFMIEKIKENINKSELFSFSSSRSEKFINVQKPNFILTYNYEKCLEVYPKKISSMTDEVDFVVECVYQEVIRPFSSYLLDALTNRTEDDRNKDEIFKEISDLEELLEIGTIIFSSIFGMKVEIQNKIMHLEYII